MNTTRQCRDGYVPFPCPQSGSCPLSEGAVERIDSALLVRDLCRDRPTDVLEAIKKRYLRVSTQDLDIFLVPPENLIFKRIVLPLKSAKQAFCFADFIACVALCGMVCEMAILFLCDLAASLWDMNRLRHEKIFAGGNYDDSPRNNGSESCSSSVPFPMNLQRMHILSELSGGRSFTFSVPTMPG
jgi:hypothetical protein